MPGLNARERVIAAKVESVYGTDPTPVGSDCLPVSDLDVSPMEGSIAENDNIKSYFGQNERQMAEKFMKISFKTDLGGHAAFVKGATPKLDALFRGCAFSGTQGNLSISGITRISTTATATTASTHGLSVGDKVQISGAAETDYNVTATILSVPTNTTFTYAVANNPTTPATGTILMKKDYTYGPITNSIESTCIYANYDGVLHKFLGARGTWSLDLSVKNIPKIAWEFIAPYTAPADAAAISPDYSSWTKPVVVNNGNTTSFSLLGYSAVMESLSLAMNNETSYENLVGSESAEIRNRKASGSVSIRATTVAQKDYWTSVSNQTEGSLAITHGKQNGNKVVISAPRVTLDSPKYKDLNGQMMFTANLALLPNTGNDELTISFQ